jgi:hypothetical protein
VKAYLHKNFCGLGDRVIVHPSGLPPGWVESNLDEETQRKAIQRAYSYHEVSHLNPDTLDLIETFPVQ